MSGPSSITARRRGALPAVALVAGMALTGALAAQQVGFAREVLPILSDRCFRCHGPDAGARKAGLRLDDRTSALASRDGRAAIVPGRPEASELLRRVTSPDVDEVMPPPDSKLALRPAEIATLRRWIEQGAEWSTHWSFVPPTEPAVPEVAAADWPRSELDHFVLARLEAQGRAPNAAAEPAALLRRVTLDLIGLPPTPAEIDAFVADPSDLHYRRIVDRLLASPHYGERMAWPWLEAARYADTDGYQADPTRTMWPWRDWLVRALDDNLPFDRFTEQVLAGDLLPDATDEQVLASGFLRNNAHNGEGGRIAEETRVENVFDRTETVATVWMGLTFECARCHDHKYDPIAQRDYYRLFAFFDQTSESGGGRGARGLPPTMPYLDQAARARIAALDSRVQALDLALYGDDELLDRGQRDWQLTTAVELRRATAAMQSVQPGPWRLLGPFAAPAGDGAGLFAAEFGPEVNWPIDPAAVHAGQAWRREPGLVDGEPFELSSEIAATYLHRVLVAPTARRLTLSLGSDDAIRVWCNGEQVLANNVRRGVAPDQERVAIDLRQGTNDLLLKIVNTGGRSGVYCAIADEQVGDLPGPVALALLAAPADRAPDADRVLRRHYRQQHAPGWREREAEWAALAARRDELREQAVAVMVMDQLPATRRRVTRVLERGGYTEPRAAVTAGTPAFLPSLPEVPAGEQPDRLTLARWLVSGAHPLTARVAVNRAWQTFFGRGLVATAEDFGRQGDAPTHPGLLDWLAARFVASGWDVKALHRTIVTSATYRQSAAAPALDYAVDPNNELLARSPRHRLPAWMLRDQALVLGDRLVDRLGGPPVRPYQPDGVWAEATFDAIRYRRDQGENLYRRSLYVFWRRIVGPTFLFDTAPRQACVVRRTRTNTPLHALVTWNETAFVEAARGLAERSCRFGGAQPEQRIVWAFRAATAREPDLDERRLLLQRFERSRAHFADDPAAAAAWLAVGDAPADASIAPHELAAYAVVASILLNLDEVLTRP